MREALLCESPSDIVLSAKKKRSDDDEAPPQLVVAAPVLPIGRSRSQAATRRVTPTTTATTAVTTTAAASSIERFLPNGDRSWKRNLQDGQGRYVWQNGNEYVGEWKAGVISGRGVLIWANGNKYDGQWENGVPKGSGIFTWPDGSCYVGCWNKDLKIQQLNGTFYPANGGKEQNFDNIGPFAAENLTITMRKRSSVDGARGSLAERTFPRICIWESDGEAGDITCDIIDNVEASMFYRNGTAFDRSPS